MANNCWVLVVEDDVHVAELLRDVLTAEGNDVALARDAQSMRNALAARRFEVVVLDVGLPSRENGLALAPEAAGYGCGVVLVTAHHHFDDALAESGYPYLLKPFRIEKLLRAIERAIDRGDVEGTLGQRGEVAS